jgi:hypothetical protein
MWRRGTLLTVIAALALAGCVAVAKTAAVLAAVRLAA